MHTVLLVEKGLIYTMGRNIEGQLGAGHTNCVEQPILVDFIKHRTIVVRATYIQYICKFILNNFKLIE